jgi:hypothetical protein
MSVNYVVWNEDKTEGFLSQDKDAAKIACGTLLTPFGDDSLAGLFNKKFKDDERIIQQLDIEESMSLEVPSDPHMQVFAIKSEQTDGEAIFHLVLPNGKKIRLTAGGHLCIFNQLEEAGAKLEFLKEDKTEDGRITARKYTKTFWIFEKNFELNLKPKYIFKG